MALSMLLDGPVKKLLRLAVVVVLIAAIAGGCGRPEEEMPVTTGPEEELVTVRLMTECQIMDYHGALLGTATYTYDDRGLLTQIRYESVEEDPWDYVTTYTYDDHGHMTSQVHEIPDKDISSTYQYSYTYHEDGQVDTFTATYNGEQQAPYVFCYDQKGRCDRIQCQGVDVITIEYDANDHARHVHDLRAPDYPQSYQIYYDSCGCPRDVPLWQGTLPQSHQGDQLEVELGASYTFTYTNGVLSQIQRQGAWDDREEEFQLDQWGDLIYHKGQNGRKAYTFQQVQISPEYEVMTRGRSIFNENAPIAAYYDRPEYFFLPHPSFG